MRIRNTLKCAYQEIGLPSCIPVWILKRMDFVIPLNEWNEMSIYLFSISHKYFSAFLFFVFFFVICAPCRTHFYEIIFLWYENIISGMLRFFIIIAAKKYKPRKKKAKEIYVKKKATEYKKQGVPCGGSKNHASYERIRKMCWKRLPTMKINWKIVCESEQYECVFWFIWSYFSP